MLVRVILGATFFLVYGLGMLDQFDKLTNRESYLEGLSEEVREYAMSFPAWFPYAWLFASIAGVAGAVALIARMQVSVQLFAAAFIVLVIVTAYTYACKRSPLVTDAIHLGFSGGLLVFSASAIWAAMCLTN